MLVKSAQLGAVGCALHALHLSLHLPSQAKLWRTLQLRGQIHSPYFSSAPICTLWEACFASHWIQAYVLSNKYRWKQKGVHFPLFTRTSFPGVFTMLVFERMSTYFHVSNIKNTNEKKRDFYTQKLKP